MKILALETSCDETSCAIVQDGRTVLSLVISSQSDFHAKYGGVIPEFAARQHLDVVNWAIQEALDQANLTLPEVDAVAATLGPGLVGALLVGATAGKTLSLIANKPFLGVNHLHAHVASNYLHSDLEPPFLGLLISGGHTQLLHVAAYDQITLLGETCDDAVGEAYDKVARMLGLPYPGGPHLDKLAQTGDPTVYRLTRPKTDNPMDFSYSGLKTATLRLVEKELPTATDPDTVKRNVAAAFQHAATQILVQKTMDAAQTLGLNTLAIAGGVAANSAVRLGFEQAIQARTGFRLFIPKLIYCTDNAAMVGAAAYFAPLTKDIGTEVFSRGGPVTA